MYEDTVKDARDEFQHPIESNTNDDLLSFGEPEPDDDLLSFDDDFDDIDIVNHSRKGNPLVKTMAAVYYDRGWCPIPVRRNSKKPVSLVSRNPNTGEKEFHWSKVRGNDGDWLSDGDFRKYTFRRISRKTNIGVYFNLSPGLVDVDLDCREAITLARLWLPSTLARFGRKSANDSHWLYKCEELNKSDKFEDPLNPREGRGEQKHVTILELRKTGQTVFPPSIHTSGESITWSGVPEGEVPELAVTDAETLLKVAKKIAGATLLIRHWHEGAWHDGALALAGALLKSGWMVEDVKEFIEVVATQKGMSDVADRLKCVDDTVEKLAEDEPVSGWTQLKEFVAKEVVEKLQKWLGTGQDDRIPNDVKRFPDQFIELIDSCYLMEEGKVSCVVDTRKPQTVCKTTLSHFHTQHEPLTERTETPSGTATNRSISKFWQASPYRKEVITEEYFPGQPRIVETERGFVHNIYMQPDLVIFNTLPRKTLLDPLWRQMEYMFPEKKRREKMLDYMAFLIQRPSEHVMWAPLIISIEEGVGKNLFVNVLKALVGPTNTESVDPKVFAKGGTEHDSFMVNKRLVYVDEVHVERDRYKVWNWLKSLLTTDEFTVNRKGIQKHYAEQCFANYFFMSNHLNALPIDEKSRRIDVHIITGAKLPQEHYTDLVGFIKDRKAMSELYTILMKRDISKFNPGEAPEVTTDKLELIENSLNEEGRAARDFLETNPHGVFMTSQIKERESVVNEWDYLTPSSLRNRLLLHELRQQGARTLFGGKQINWRPKDGTGRHKAAVWARGGDAKFWKLEDTPENRALVCDLLDEVNKWINSEEDLDNNVSAPDNILNFGKKKKD